MTKPLHGGHVDGLILAVLADRPCHGYAVIEELRRRSDGVLEGNLAAGGERHRGAERESERSDQAETHTGMLTAERRP